MKKKRKWMPFLGMLLLLVSLWGVTVQAADFETVEAVEETLGTEAATEQVKSLKQTKATDYTMTIQWKRPAGATRYGIKIKAAGDSEYVLDGVVRSTKDTLTYTIKNLKSNTYYDVRVWGESDAVPQGHTKTIQCHTAPGKVVGLAYDAYPSTKRMTFYWNRKDTADGYELYKYSLEGKLLSRYEVPQKDVKKLQKTIGVGSNFYSYRIRAYTMINGVKCRGRLRYFYTAIQPKGETVRQSVGGTTATITWSKINGANYEVYQSTSKDGNFKKVATVSTTQTTLKNLKKGQTYYIIVRATKKIDGAVQKSPDTYMYYFTKK